MESIFWWPWPIRASTAAYGPFLCAVRRSDIYNVSESIKLTQSPLNHKYFYIRVTGRVTITEVILMFISLELFLLN